MSSYATVADLHDYFDWREIGDMISDDKDQISAADQRDTANVYGARIAKLLSRASGEIEGALLKGGRYTAADLSGLTGNSAAMLAGIVCEFVVLYLHERRPFYKPEVLEKLRESTRARLKYLGSGDDIFGSVTKAVDAGMPTVDGPSTQDYIDLNLLPDRIKYFPRRYLPNNR